MESEPGQSGVRLCKVCGHLDSQNNFKLNSCRNCWKWFKYNIDFYNKFCHKKCDEAGMLATCESCRLKKFVEITEYRGGVRQCQYCDQKTLIQGKNPRCSRCRQLKKEITSKDCTCKNIGKCSCYVLAPMHQHNSSVKNHQKSLAEVEQHTQVEMKLPDQTTTQQSYFHEIESPSSECDETVEYKIDISAIPENVKKEAKEQLYYDKCWVVQLKRLPLPPPTTRKGKKRQRDETSRNEENVPFQPIFDKKHVEKLPKKTPNCNLYSSYNMKRLSDTKVVIQKPTGVVPPGKFSSLDTNYNYTPHSTLIPPPLEDIDTQETNPQPGTSNDIFYNRHSNLDISKTAFPRKNHLVKRGVLANDSARRTESSMPSEIILDRSLQTTVDNGTQTGSSLMCVERRNFELEQRNSELERHSAEWERHRAELERRIAKVERRNAKLERRNMELKIIVDATRSLSTPSPAYAPRISKY